MKIAICVGHNSKYKGAVGSLGIYEYDFNKALAKDIVEHNFAKVELKIFERKPINSYTKQMKLLHNSIDKWGADIAIELHFNAAYDTSVQGHEILYCSKNKKGKKIAKLFDRYFDKFLPNKDRNLKTEKDTHRGNSFLCKGKSINIILEPFFAAHQHLYKKGSEQYSELLGSILLAIYKIGVTYGNKQI